MQVVHIRDIIAERFVRPLLAFHFLVPLTYFPTNLVYPFTLRVTGIMTSENNMSENENTTEDEIIVELTDHLNSVYPSLPMNQDDSI